MQSWASIVVCPECAGDLSEVKSGMRCKNCGTEYASVDGILALVRPGTRDTALDVKTYAGFASVAPQALEATFQQFQHAVGEACALEGTMLEIGTGTGLLTEAMLRHAKFQQIVSTDVSLAFLRHTRDRLRDVSDNLLLMACDGNVLPLRQRAFDFVLGRSVLHHLLHYQKTLSQIHELLRPGGTAIFFEPVQMGKALIAFMFRIILGVETSTGAIGLTPIEMGNLGRAVKDLTRSVSVKQSEAVLAKMEDKYIFDVDKLCDEARALGFEARYVDGPNMDYTYFSYLPMHLKSYGIRPEVAAKVGWLREAFGDTLGAVVPQKLTGPMGYFVFKKADGKANQPSVEIV
jgi:ubiquinone/menaquinone biosynthesis C-methylase UbiE/uncharacterized protein YbaR (Trm112 family)